MQMNMQLKDRVDSYNTTFDWALLCYTEKSKVRIYGTWILGQDYRSKQQYYGEYPPNYLKRVHSMFPDSQELLHLFSGVVEKGLWTNETTFDIDIDLNPDVVGNAVQLSSYFGDKAFDLIIADPPYSNEDAKNYGTPMINRNVVVKECYNILEEGDFLVWLDQVLPMYRKDELAWVGAIGVVRSTNHRVRCVFIWQKQESSL